MKTKELSLLYKGSEFFTKVLDGGLISLTDLWRGEGAVETKKPDNWIHSAETAEFMATCLKSTPGGLLANKPDPHRGSKKAIRAWADTIIKECEKQGLIKRTRGRAGATFAHRQIALAYAGYLSSELRILVQQVFIERLEETADPELGITRSRKRAVRLWLDRGKTPAWIAERVEGIDKRNEFTSVLGSHGVHGPGYGECTNAIYTKILHGTAKEVREVRMIPVKINLRDTFDEIELGSIKLAEMLAKRNIQAASVFGQEECSREASRAGRAVSVALQMAEAAQPRREIR